LLTAVYLQNQKFKNSPRGVFILRKILNKKRTVINDSSNLLRFIIKL